MCSLGSGVEALAHFWIFLGLVPIRRLTDSTVDSFCQRIRSTANYHALQSRALMKLSPHSMASSSHQGTPACASGKGTAFFLHTAGNVWRASSVTSWAIKNKAWALSRSYCVKTSSAIMNAAKSPRLLANAVFRGPMAKVPVNQEATMARPKNSSVPHLPDQHPDK